MKFHEMVVAYRDKYLHEDITHDAVLFHQYMHDNLAGWISGVVLSGVPTNLLFVETINLVLGAVAVHGIPDDLDIVLGEYKVRA